MLKIAFTDFKATETEKVPSEPVREAVQGAYDLHTTQHQIFTRAHLNDEGASGSGRTVRIVWCYAEKSFGSDTGKEPFWQMKPASAR